MAQIDNIARQLALAVALLAGLSALTTGCGQASDGPETVDTAAFDRLAAEAPPRLAALYSQGDALIDGGEEGYREAIARLRGFPVVVNIWASWCGPCRAEFPHFRQVALERGTEVAFLGLDSDDNDEAAETFLRNHPLPYPSFTDPDKRIATELGATFGLPATVFYNRDGEQAHIRHGVYTSNEELVADIERYALEP